MAHYDPRVKLWRGRICPTVLNPEANVAQVVINLLSRTPEKITQINVDDGSEMTCAEMKRRIARVAQNLTKLGCRKGDLVSLACVNSENVVPVYIGCMAIGLAVNPLAPVFGKDDFAHMMKLTQSRVVFCDEDNREVVEQAVREAIEVEPAMFVMGQRGGRCRSIDELLVPVPGEDNYMPEYLGDSKKLLAMILCSSGTTGLPKGVCLSHALLIESDTFATELNAGPIFNFSPLFWATGMFATLTSLYFSRARVITSKPFSEELLISIINEHQVEDLFTPPSYISALLSHPSIAGISFPSVKRWTLGGSMVSQQLLDNLGAHLPNGYAKPVYGTSEIGIITAADTSFAYGSVGTLIANLQGKIVDDDGRRLGPEEKGEVRFKHKHRMMGYLHNEEVTEAAFDEEGFFKTGDIGYFDKDGYLYVVDRIKDIIKYKNYQISPSELESVIQKIDGVKLVCVVGVLMEDKSSDLATAVVERTEGSTLTEAQVVQLFDAQVSDYKRLRGGVLFVDKLPTSPAGKVLRRLVKELVTNRKQCDETNRALPA